MILEEREHLEKLARVYTGNIQHLEMQVAMCGGTYSIEPKLRNLLDQQRTELADVHRRLVQCEVRWRSCPTEKLNAYFQVQSLGKRERMMVTMLLSLLTDQTDEDVSLPVLLE